MDQGYIFLLFPVRKGFMKHLGRILISPNTLKGIIQAKEKLFKKFVKDTLLTF